MLKGGARAAGPARSSWPAADRCCWPWPSAGGGGRRRRRRWWRPPRTRRYAGRPARAAQPGKLRRGRPATRRTPAAPGPAAHPHAVVEAHGTDRVEAVTVAALDRDWRPVAGTERRIACDALAVGHGLRPATRTRRRARLRPATAPTDRRRSTTNSAPTSPAYGRRVRPPASAAPSCRSPRGGSPDGRPPPGSRDADPTRARAAAATSRPAAALRRRSMAVSAAARPLAATGSPRTPTSAAARRSPPTIREAARVGRRGRAYRQAPHPRRDGLVPGPDVRDGRRRTRRLRTRAVQRPLARPVPLGVLARAAAGHPERGATGTRGRGPHRRPRG